MVNTKFTFPYQLHEMLEDAERQGFDTIVSWIPSSSDSSSDSSDSSSSSTSTSTTTPTKFKVHDVVKFENDIMPTYFPTMTRYKSFLRQLNIYGYTRNVSPSSSSSMSLSLNDRGAYYHPLMVRYNTALCSQMVRTKIKQSQSQATKAIKNATKNGKSSSNKPKSCISSNEMVIEKNVIIESNPLHSMILKSYESSTTTTSNEKVVTTTTTSDCCYNVVPIDTTTAMTSGSSSCDDLTTETLKNQIKLLLSQLEQVQQVQQEVVQQRQQQQQVQQQQQFDDNDDCEWFASDECDISFEMANNIIAILGN